MLPFPDTFLVKPPRTDGMLIFQKTSEALDVSSNTELACKEARFICNINRMLKKFEFLYAIT